MLADVGNVCRIRLKLFHGNNGRFFYGGAGYDERVRNFATLHEFLAFNIILEVWNVEYFSYEHRLFGRRCSEKRLPILKPGLCFVISRVFEFTEDFSSREDPFGGNHVVETLPKGFKDGPIPVFEQS